MKKTELESSANEQSEVHSQALTAPKLLFKATLLAFVFVFFMVLVTALGATIYAYSQLNVFLKTASLTRQEVTQFVKTGLSSEITNTNGVTTFLILGVDKVANKENAPTLTDTVMLVSLNQTNGEVHTISLPRDLWSEEYKTKINALYVYGEQRDPAHPENFTREVIQNLTDIPVHYTVVISLDMLSELVDTLGGVTVPVTEEFTDTQFPRSDVDLSQTTDPKDIYETISFEKGPQKMDGETVLKYIRSRNSQGDTGTDLARSERQQLVISSIAQSLTKKESLTNPVLMGDIYKWYQKYMQAAISEQEVVAFAKILYPHRENISFNSHPVTIYPDDENGIIEHPPVEKTNNQWTYIVRDSENFKQYFNDMLMKSK